jgi:GNAT superfamily N-acetyltransferase
MIHLQLGTVEGYGLAEMEATVPITVRQARPEDAATIADFNCRLALESEGKTLQPAVVSAGVAASLADPENKGPYFLAEIDGQVVGTMQITFEWSDWRNGWAWWIQGVFVREDARRQGVFRTLYEHVIGAAQRRGNVIAVRLYVEKENVRAQQTYLSLGMNWLSYGMMERSFYA